MTLNQQSFKERFCGYAPAGACGPFYSFDLSAFTDRFPMSYQTFIVRELLGQEYSLAWERLLVSHPYHVTFPSKLKSVLYGAGQPMGAYSSWAVCTLAHH